jgi:multisite-specific tRNA:(cytosine-C5)-methyltransferase
MENNENKFKEVQLNNLIKEYYRSILNLSTHEYEKFLQLQIEKLPITFRINKVYNLCEFLEMEVHATSFKLDLQFNRYNFNYLDNIFEIESLDKVKHKEMKEILIRENDLGILRQELVAMIPVSLAEISDDSVVMDMCAAPGNKSVQILEIMNERAREKGILPSGVLISNELDATRAQKLVHFLQGQPTINVVATMCPAQDFPLIKQTLYQPDFVFCDVPCSGDGTLRKNKGLRRRWKPDYAYKNHELQINILENSIRLCKKGGRVIYSTCSINPIENESVVAYILEKYKGQVELLDLSMKVKNNLKLNFSEGLIKWKVAYDWTDVKNIQWAYDFSQVSKNKNIIKESMFHEIYTKKNFQNNILFSDPLNLRRCLRFYSHQNNSGNFFIAVFKKLEGEKDSVKDETECCTDLITDEEEILNSLLNPGQKKHKTILDDFKEMAKEFGWELDEDFKKLEVSNKINNQEDVVKFDKFVKFRDYKENYKLLDDFYDMKPLTDPENLLNKMLYCLRSTSSKVFLFSEKLCEMIHILCEMNIDIMYSGLQCFIKERKATDRVI